MALIITGCMRSGTMTAAKIFGLKHEVQFVPGTNRGIVNDFTNIAGESSWLVKPFYQSLVDKGHSIILLVRNPIAVINSILGIGFWAKTIHEHKPYRDFILQFDAGLNDLYNKGASGFVLSVYYVVYWQRQLLRFPRIRIEDIQTDVHLNQRAHDYHDILSITEKIPKQLTKELIKLCNTLGYDTGFDKESEDKILGA